MEPVKNEQHTKIQQTQQLIRIECINNLKPKPKLSQEQV